MTGFGVTRGLRVKLTERLEVIHGELVAEEVEENILQSTTDRRVNYLSQLLPG